MVPAIATSSNKRRYHVIFRRLPFLSGREAAASSLPPGWGGRKAVCSSSSVSVFLLGSMAAATRLGNGTKERKFYGNCPKNQ